jgi:Family of unknown function (DUF6134)
MIGCQAISKTFACAAAAALLAMPLAALADGNAGEYTFAILKDGAPVGVHRVLFARDGARVDIREATAIEVRLAMIPVFSFQHEAHQIWENGRAVRIDAVTNDNGEQLHITVRPSGRGYIRTVNGRVDRFDESTAVLALWNKDTLEHHAFFSAAEDKTLQADFEFAGRERITIAGTELDADHYRMVGDEERELWYDMAGHIAKVRLRRLGSDIEYVRDQLTPRAPGSSACARAC